MEAENKRYANMQGDGQGQSTPNTPLLQQQGQSPAPPYDAPPSGAGYGGGYGATPSQQVIVVATSTSVVRVQPVESFGGAILYSCLVFWLCGIGCPFGLIGFFLAMAASDKAATDVQGARSLGRASYIVSTVGIVFSIILTTIFFGVFYGSYDSDDGICAYYQYDDVCYRHASYMTSDECRDIDGVYDYFVGRCYYD